MGQGRPATKAVRGLAAALAALAMAIALAACASGIEGPVETATSKVELEKKASGSLDISNWPLYIDKKTVPDFEKATGVSVAYHEDINSNEEFFNKLQPQLATGSSGGRSILVLADYMVAKMIKLGYLMELDHAGLPEVEANLAKNLRNVPFDPGRKYSVPWQSGMTGIIVNKEKAPDVHSICDLFNPKYKGKVDFLNEVRETVPLVMKCEGVELEKATEADWLKAIEKLKEAASDGQISRFTGNDYAQDLTSGNAVAVMGWSGDAVQLQADNPNLEWRMPTEGCMLWSEDMIIPVGAPNPTAAEAFMNFVYKPEVQAGIAAYVNYVTPVEGVQEVLQKTEPEVAENHLIFPSSSFTKNCSPTPTLEGTEEKNVIKAFDEVLNG
jgi:spermidine/putrescine transport system substrate-binding protein